MLDFNRPIQTRYGRKARILATDRRVDSDAGDSLVVAIDMGRYESIHTYFPDGSYNGAISSLSPMDLINVPEKVEAWVIRKPCGYFFAAMAYPSEERAKEVLRKGMTAAERAEYRIVHLTGEV